MKTAERDLKNIRKILKYNVKDFSECIGVSEEELMKIEKGERKITTAELYLICSILLNFIEALINPKNDIIIEGDEDYKQRIKDNKTFIIKMLSDFIGNYHPMNQDNNRFNKVIRTSTYIKDDEPIDLSGKRKVRKKAEVY